MRMPNDTRLAEEVPELHLILGGHDHHYEKKMVREREVLWGLDFVTMRDLPSAGW